VRQASNKYDWHYIKRAVTVITARVHSFIRIAKAARVA
jgi:hypothetical protein